MQRKTYTKKQIDSWKRTYDALPAEVLQLQKTLLDLGEKLDVIRLKQQELVRDAIQPLEMVVCSLEARINELVLPEEIAGLEGLCASHDESINKLHQEIANCQNSLKPLDAEVVHLEMSLEVDDTHQQVAEDDRDILLMHLAEQQQLRQPYVAKLNDLQNQLRSENTVRRKLELQLQQDNQLLENARAVEQRSQGDDIAELRKQLADNRSKLKSYEGERLSLLNTIRSHEQEMQKIREELDSLNNRQLKIRDDQFMQQYVFYPDRLVYALKDQVDSVLGSYAYDHPAGQSESVRIWLLDMMRQLEAILSESTLDVKGHQLTYNRATGLIWYAIEMTELHDTIFATQLRNAVLGDDCIDRLEAISDYALFMHLKGVSNMTAQELYDAELAQFNAACDRLDQRIQAMPGQVDRYTKNFRAAGKALLGDIKSQQRKQGAAFDTRFYTNVLNTNADLLAEPDNLALQQRALELAQYNQHGKPSMRKKIAGLALMVLGAAIGLTGIGLALGTFGFTSPVSLPLMCAGGVIAATGALIFYSGCSRGLHKRLSNFNQAAKSVANLQHGIFFQPASSSDAPLESGALACHNLSAKF